MQPAEDGPVQLFLMHSAHGWKLMSMKQENAWEAHIICAACTLCSHAASGRLAGRLILPRRTRKSSYLFFK